MIIQLIIQKEYDFETSKKKKKERKNQAAAVNNTTIALYGNLFDIFTCKKCLC